MFRVLIVDDEPMIREGLRTLINWNEIGFEVCGDAVNGKDGISKAMELKPDFIITDINMPGINGLRMIEELKRHNMECVFLLLTGYSDFSYAQTAMRLGLRDYILKPIDKEELTKTVKKIYNILLARDRE